MRQLFQKALDIDPGNVYALQVRPLFIFFSDKEEDSVEFSEN